VKHLVLYALTFLILVLAETPPTVVWFGESQDPLSNYFLCQVYFAGKWFSSAEQIYWWRYADHIGQYVNKDQIERTNDPAMIKLIGQSLVTNGYEDDWENIQERCMLDILLAKAQYCPDYALALSLSDKDCVFKFKSWDPFWGALGGQNKLGRLHSHVKHIQSALAAHEVDYINNYRLRHHGLHYRGYANWT